MPAEESPAAFYDGLAGEYHAIYDDWWAGAQWHAGIVDKVLQSAGVDRGSDVLDCACGIGTQALGLAHLGYKVTGTDISANAIARAEREAAARAIDVTLAVADMRSVQEVQPGPFDAAICCDNALPHLLTDADLDRALLSIRRTLRAGGVFLASARTTTTACSRNDRRAFPRSFVIVPRVARSTARRGNGSTVARGSAFTCSSSRTGRSMDVRGTRDHVSPDNSRDVDRRVRTCRSC